MASFSIVAQAVVGSPSSSPTFDELGDIEVAPEDTSAGAAGAAASSTGGGLVPEGQELVFPPGEFPGCLTLRISWRQPIVCSQGGAWIVDGVPPGTAEAVHLKEAGLDPLVTVRGLAGVAAQTSATVEAAGVVNTPKTFADEGLRPASVVATMKATVALGMSVAQEP